MILFYLTAASQSPLQTFLRTPAVDSLSTGVYIKDLRTGRVMVQHNASKPLLGASTMKVVTVASLFHFTDINDRFTTNVYTAGCVNSDRILEGNLIVVGSGDPTLNSDRSPKSADFVLEIVAVLKKKNIKGIRGDVLVEQGIFTLPAQPSSWSVSDCRQYYGAGAFGFNFERNHRGSASVSDPAGVFKQQLYKALAGAGITIDRAGYTGGGRNLILSHKSAPMDEIMRSCIMRSDNLYAECLLRKLALVNGRRGSTEDGADISLRLWERDKAPTSGVVIKDGSGLSRVNRLSSLFLAYVLETMSLDPYYASFFPLAGQEGTLSSFLRNTRLDSYIALKTGSMRGVQGYAGYKLDENYAPTHVVVLLANDFSSRDALRKAVEKLLLSVL